jgi:hypothetical protein
MDDIKALLLEAPDSQLSVGAKQQIQKSWSDPPTRAQVSATLDYCAHGGDASTFTMLAMSAYRDSCPTSEDVQHE